MFSCRAASRLLLISVVVVVVVDAGATAAAAAERPWLHRRAQLQLSVNRKARHCLWDILLLLKFILCPNAQN